jgi:hypothetical protein
LYSINPRSSSVAMALSLAEPRINSTPEPAIGWR